jgi:hypothetical protein
LLFRQCRPEGLRRTGQLGVRHAARDVGFAMTPQAINRICGAVRGSLFLAQVHHQYGSIPRCSFYRRPQLFLICVQN